MLIQISVMVTGLERCQRHIAAPTGGLKATKTNCCYFRIHANMWCGTARGPDPPPLQSPTGFPERDACMGMSEWKRAGTPVCNTISGHYSLLIRWTEIRMEQRPLPWFQHHGEQTQSRQASQCMIHAPDRDPRACDDIYDNMIKKTLILCTSVSFKSCNRIETSA